MQKKEKAHQKADAKEKQKQGLKAGKGYIMNSRKRQAIFHSTATKANLAAASAEISARSWMHKLQKARNTEWDCYSKEKDELEQARLWGYYSQLKKKLI